MSTDKAKVIVNPVAAAGKVGKQWPQLRHTLLQYGLQFEADLTQYPGHATELARKALDDDFRHLISIGGDGTLNEIVNGLFMDGHVPSDVVLSIIPGGTGSDFVRTLGIPHNPKQACPATLSPKTRVVDIGEIHCVREGQHIKRYFVNVAGMGFDGEVSARVNRMDKRLGGTIPYLTGLVITLLSYTNKDVTLTFDSQQIHGRFNSVIICNGQYFGGGMWIGPGAAADDGIFDVVLLKDLNKLEFLANVLRVYKGTHLTHPKVDAFQAPEIHVEAKQRMFIQADGEVIGEAPATFRIIPAALQVHI